MKIGSKIYYDKVTGEVILITEERYGSVVETSREHDFKIYAPLVKRDLDSVEMLQIEFGAYASDYAEGGSIMRIDLDTLEPLFTYPDPTDPETPQESSPALSKQIEDLAQENVLLRAQNSALSERADFVEDVIAEMAAQVYQ